MSAVPEMDTRDDANFRIYRRDETDDETDEDELDPDNDDYDEEARAEILGELEEEGDGWFNLFHIEFQCLIRDEVAFRNCLQDYVLCRLDKLKRAHVDDKLDSFVILDYPGSDHIHWPMTRIVAEKIVQVFRYYRYSRNIQWDYFQLDDSLRYNEHLHWVVQQAKAMGMFSAFGMGGDLRSTIPPDSRINREFVLQNPNLRHLNVSTESEAIFQTARDALKTITNTTTTSTITIPDSDGSSDDTSATTTRLTELGLSCEEEYSHLLPLLTEGLQYNNSLTTLRMYSGFGSYIRLNDPTNLIDLIQALPTNTTLTSFQLGDYLLTPTIQDALYKRLIEPDCKLGCLTLGESEDDYYAYDGLKYPSLADAIRQCKSLHMLEIENYMCTCNDLIMLLNAANAEFDSDCDNYNDNDHDDDNNCSAPLNTISINNAKLSHLDLAAACTTTPLEESFGLEVLELDLEILKKPDNNNNNNAVNVDRNSPDYKRKVRQTQESIVMLLQKIPSLVNLGSLSEHWPKSPVYTLQAGVLLGFNQITQGYLTSSDEHVPLNLWKPLIEKVDKCIKRPLLSEKDLFVLRSYQELRIRCKASVVYWLVRNHAPNVFDCRETFLRPKQKFVPPPLPELNHQRKKLRIRIKVPKYYK